MEGIKYTYIFYFIQSPSFKCSVYADICELIFKSFSFSSSHSCSYIDIFRVYLSVSLVTEHIGNVARKKRTFNISDIFFDTRRVNFPFIHQRN